MDFPQISNQILLFSNLVVYILSISEIKDSHKRIIYLLFISQTISFIIYDKDEINPIIAFFSFMHGLFYSYNLSLQENNYQANTKIDEFFSLLKFGANYHIVVLFLLFLVLFFDSFNNSISQVGYFCLFLAIITILNKYDYLGIKSQFNKEIEFIFFFTLIVTALFTLSSAIDIFSRYFPIFVSLIDRESSVEFFLSRPLVSSLSILGIQTWYEGQVIFYPDNEIGLISQVHITKDCSGLDSVVIFSSAFTSYLITNDKVTRGSTFLWWSTGIIISYFANLFRMILIILAGHYYGSDFLFWVHKNVGWLIFIIWFLIFWTMFTNYYEKMENVSK